MTLPKRFLFTLGTVVLCGAGIELLSWIVLRQMDAVTIPNYSATSTVFPFSSALLWEMSPNDQYTDVKGIQYQTNQKGFRVFEQSVDAEGTILLVGDSSTYGFGVDTVDAYAGLLGDCFQYNVFNMAVPGYSSTQSKLQLQRLLDIHTISPPIKQVVISNLWSDMMLAPKTDTQRIAQLSKVTEQQQVFSSQLYQFSQTFRLLNTLRFGRQEYEPISIDAILQAKESGDTRRVPPNEYQANLHALIELTQKIGATPSIVLLPTNVYEDHPPPEEQDPYRHAAHALGIEYGVTVVDFDQNGSFESSDFLDIVHPSPSGHLKIGTTLCSTLLADSTQY